MLSSKVALCIYAVTDIKMGVSPKMFIDSVQHNVVDS